MVRKVGQFFFLLCKHQDDRHALIDKGFAFSQGALITFSVFCYNRSLHDMRSSEDILWVRLEGLAFLFTQPKVAKKAFMQIGRVIFFDDITRSQDQPTCLRACVRVNLDRTLIPGFFI